MLFSVSPSLFRRRITVRVRETRGESEEERGTFTGEREDARGTRNDGGKGEKAVGVVPPTPGDRQTCRSMVHGRRQRERDLLQEKEKRSRSSSAAVRSSAAKEMRRRRSCNVLVVQE